jgi:hypothetical protein
VRALFEQPVSTSATSKHDHVVAILAIDTDIDDIARLDMPECVTQCP